MTRKPSTKFGEPLSETSKILIREVRSRLNENLHLKFDTDFNVYRFIANAERLHSKIDEIIEFATKNLDTHLRLRKYYKLDEVDDIPFSKNPLFSENFLPTGQLQESTDSSGRPLWFLEYTTITVDGIAKCLKTSSACKFQFWQFEHMLKHVNKQELKSGKYSSIHHVIDMAGYEINPFTMLFVSNGDLSYYSNLFHYENYPELVYPVDIVNVSKWVHLPYKIIKGVMPAGFSDRFRLHDNQFMNEIEKEISLENLPETLGGKNKDIKCIPASTDFTEKYWKCPSKHFFSQLEHFQVYAKKRKIIKIEITNFSQTISWYYKCDGDLYFGIFYNLTEIKEKELNLKNVEMIYPFLKYNANYVHEFDFLNLEKNGFYFIVFCNNHSWLQKRNVEAMIQMSNLNGNNVKNVHIDGTVVDTATNSLKEMNIF